MIKTRSGNPSKEAGNSLVSAVFALVVLMALALPAFEAGRAVVCRLLAASAAEDVAKAVAAKPSTTQAEIDRLVATAYPQLGGDVEVSTTIGPLVTTPYTHRLNNSAGGFSARSSHVAIRNVSVSVTARKDFATAAGAFLSAAGGGGASGYSVTGSASSVIDETVSTGRW